MPGLNLSQYRAGNIPHILPRVHFALNAPPGTTRHFINGDVPDDRSQHPYIQYSVHSSTHNRTEFAVNSRYMALSSVPPAVSRHRHDRQQGPSSPHLLSCNFGHRAKQTALCALISLVYAFPYPSSLSSHTLLLIPHTSSCYCGPSHSITPSFTSSLGHARTDCRLLLSAASFLFCFGSQFVSFVVSTV